MKNISCSFTTTDGNKLSFLETELTFTGVLAHLEDKQETKVFKNVINKATNSELMNRDYRDMS